MNLKFLSSPMPKETRKSPFLPRPPSPHLHWNVFINLRHLEALLSGCSGLQFGLQSSSGNRLPASTQIQRYRYLILNTHIQILENTEYGHSYTTGYWIQTFRYQRILDTGKQILEDTGYRHTDTRGYWVYTYRHQRILDTGIQKLGDTG